MYELLAEQSRLHDKISAMENQIMIDYTTIDNEANAGKIVLENELKPLYEELSHINDGEGSTQADIDHSDRVMKKIKEKQDVFCSKYTPRMLKFIQECKDTYTGSFADYDRMEEIQFQVTAAQTGTKLIPVGKGMYSIQAVGQYLEYLGKAYTYKLYRPEK
jgi:hypothetical protein